MFSMININKKFPEKIKKNLTFLYEFNIDKSILYKKYHKNDKIEVLNR